MEVAKNYLNYEELTKELISNLIDHIIVGNVKIVDGNIIVNNIMFKGMFLVKTLILYDIALTLGWPATYGKAFISTLESKPHKFMLFLSYLSVAIDGISLLKTIFGNEESKWSLY